MEENDFFGSPWGHGPMFGRRWDKMQMFQARRGDMRGIILRALTERPMHGYEIIRSLEEASHGMWRPSPGSIYPTLQLLEEEDLVTAEEVQGKKVYSLTKAGKQEAEKAEAHTPWDKAGNFEGKKQLRSLIGETMHAMRAVLRYGDDESHKRLMSLLETTRDSMVELAAHAKNQEKK